MNFSISFSVTVEIFVFSFFIKHWGFYSFWRYWWKSVQTREKITNTKKADRISLLSSVKDECMNVW